MSRYCNTEGGTLQSEDCEATAVLPGVYPLRTVTAASFAASDMSASRNHDDSFILQNPVLETHLSTVGEGTSNSTFFTATGTPRTVAGSSFSAGSVHTATGTAPFQTTHTESPRTVPRGNTSSPAGGSSTAKSVSPLGMVPEPDSRGHSRVNSQSLMTAESAFSGTALAFAGTRATAMIVPTTPSGIGLHMTENESALGYCGEIEDTGILSQGESSAFDNIVQPLGRQPHKAPEGIPIKFEGKPVLGAYAAVAPYNVMPMADVSYASSHVAAQAPEVVSCTGGASSGTALVPGSQLVVGGGSSQTDMRNLPAPFSTETEHLTPEKTIVHLLDLDDV